MLLAAFGLYVALGGPLPFVVDGGPALDSVPADADAVAYTDAWLFASDTNRAVADGLLATTNRSLPGYTGPASLGAAFETLQDTDLEPKGLRSITAFGGYAPGGRPSGYRAIVLKTSWDTGPLLTAFGGNASDYTERSYRNTTVYVQANGSTEFPWVGVLGPSKYVLGNGSAVRDSVDTSRGRAPGMNTSLESGFRSLGQAPVQFAATMPEAIPGDAIAPESVTEAIDSIETVGGVYYPEGDRATVELEVTATDGATAKQIEPAVREALDFATENAPADTGKLLSGARVSRTGTVLDVSLSGSADSFVRGYRGFLESSVVQLLLGQPVGQPALEEVPASADALAYADASVVADTTTLRLIGTLATGQGGPSGEDVMTAIEQLRTASALDPTGVRSVTLFARGVTTQSNRTDAAAIVEAEWSREAVERAVANSTMQYAARTVGGVPVFVLSSPAGPLWVGALGDGHFVVGPESATRSVIAVHNGDEPAVEGQLRTSFERLHEGYLTAAVRAPPDLDLDVPGTTFVRDLSVLGASYDSGPTRVAVRTSLQFETADSAESGANTLEGLRRIAITQVDDERVAAFLDSVRVEQHGTVVSGSVSTDPAVLIDVLRWAMGAAGDDSGSTLIAPAGPRVTVVTTPGVTTS